MICPKCSGKTKVVDTRALAGNSRRRRECLACGYRFSTEEKILDFPQRTPPSIVNVKEYAKWLYNRKQRMYSKAQKK